mmetsp:Transcript_36159/g.69822  ORF Transcript_36159/g.69822 Transcript_36159/m.69822 type:complete len:223 (-) Transcript_36159:76-744(-)
MAFILVTGLSLFFIAEKIVGGTDDGQNEEESSASSSSTYDSFHARLIGLTFMAAASFAGGMIGNIQEKVMRDSFSPTQMICTFAFINLGVCVVSMWAGGMLDNLIEFLFKDDAEANSTRVALLSWSLLSILNTELCIRTVKRYGAVVTVLVTTTRKACSLITSFLAYAKPFNYVHFIGGAMVMGTAAVHKACRPKERAETRPAPEAEAVEMEEREETSDELP